MAISLKALILVSLLTDGDAVLLAPSLASILHFGVSVIVAALVARVVAKGLAWDEQRQSGGPRRTS